MTKLSAKHQKVVVGEISRWQTEGVIDDSLASSLILQYPDYQTGANVSGALSIAGASLVGLGSILFMAANWQQIPIILKLLLIFAAILISNFFGWKLRFEPGNRPKTGTGLLLLANIFFGAGIWLIAQIFNVDTHFPTGALLWALGTAFSALATGLVPLGCLASILGGLWLFVQQDWDTQRLVSNLPYFLAYTSASFGLGYYLRSRAVMWVTLIAGSLWMLLSSPVRDIALLLWGVTVFAGYFGAREKHAHLSSPFLYAGSITILGSILFTTTFGGFHYEKISTELVPIMSICLSVLGVVAWRVPKFKEEMLACAITVILFSLCLGNAEASAKLVSNIAILGVIAGFIYTGLNRIHSTGLVNVAIVFFVFDIIARYFDYFYSMMNRSVFFLIGGVVLMVVGTLAEQGRRKMVEGLQS
ncbi:MAG: DUF2157 domain-containing protein [Leptolyngbya sp.]|nr:DUF2157 domain-containing protein [Candidatus Melainabacteria bacterium]